MSGVSIIIKVRLALKIEWCKARARKTRWEEEVALLLEEMRRVIVYRRWNAAWWRSDREEDPNTDATCQQGLRAFAAEQAYLHDREADNLESRWKGVRILGQELLDGLPVSQVVQVEIDEEEHPDDNEDDLDTAEM